jgi:NAD(P)H-hydrate epimerase
MLRLTRAQVREIDRRAVDEYHMPSIVLMENAARAVADAAIEMLPDGLPLVTVVCGGGNNGGDGFAAARHLLNRSNGRFGLTVCMLVDPSLLQGDAGTNFNILKKMHPEGLWPYDGRSILLPAETHLVIDAMFGTGLTRSPQPPFSTAIQRINESEVPVLAVDVPSGLDCDMGEPFGTCIRAERTVTFVAEKVGFANPASRQYTGEVTVGDIGAPRELIERAARTLRT